MNDGFIRVGVATPCIQVADCVYNSEAIVKLMQEAAVRQVQAVVFPELCLTGYTCGDLLLSRTLQRGAERALCQVMEQTRDLEILAAVGLPVAVGTSLYNCAAVFCKGELLGIVPKSTLPNYGEFYEKRWFSPAPERGFPVSFAGQDTWFGAGQLFSCTSMPEFVVGVEICEDLWVPQPPSTAMAMSGAVVLLNLSASDEVVGKLCFRRDLVKGQSARLLCAYAYANAGQGESTTDLVFTGHNLIAENSVVVAESKPFSTGLTTADIDIERLTQERRRCTTWNRPQNVPVHPFKIVIPAFALERKVEAYPFVPSDPADLDSRCELILKLQATGLQSRLAHIGAKSVVLGVSGGLDSTLALLVAVRAFDALGLDHAGIHTITMPGFGTTGRTKSNAQKLAEIFETSFREIPIGESVSRHFQDIGHDPSQKDVTYENAQARERTQILMDLANKTGGIVIGTGDLSELALGWATYNGDQMSMYSVNASVPKTLVRHLVSFEARQSGGSLQDVLQDVLETPVSPELLPPQDGEIAQKTEELVGPYELHDFFLYYLLRFGFEPSKILRLAKSAFQGQYEESEIQAWLKVFCKRFFSQQYKRSCMPDGPKVGSVSLSPRGDWRMPSDASAALWLTSSEDIRTSGRDARRWRRYKTERILPAE